MAWTYFTSPLTAGEELTGDMWYELCEALHERFAATGQAAQVDLTVAGQIKTSGVFPRSVPISTSGAAAVMTEWTSCLSITQANWAENNTTKDALTVSSGDSFVTSTQWTAEGLTESEWNTLVTAFLSGWNDRRFWNVIRATIQRLQIVRYALPNFTLYFKNGEGSRFDPWADTLADYVASTETSSSTAGGYSEMVSTEDGSEWRVNGTRAENAITFPNILTLAVVDVWVFLDNDAMNTPPLDYVDVSLAGSTATLAIDTSDDNKLEIDTGIDIRDAQTLEIKIQSYPSPDDYQPDLGYEPRNSSGLSVNRLFIYPDWSKP